MYRGTRPRGTDGSNNQGYPNPTNYGQGGGKLPQRARSDAVVDVASALKVKNFRKLLDALGEEHLAVRLDVTIKRVQEMGDGINLSDEMAYHIENTLGLQSGFIDQVNPQLSPEDIQRIKTSLPESRDEALYEAPRLAAVSVEKTAPVAALVTAPAPPTAPAPAPVLKVKAKAITPSNTKETLMAESAVETPVDPALDPESAQRAVRRANLLLLTSPSGAKTQLGRLTGLSAANVSHRLYGNKIFDKESGEFLAAKLALPSDWFETPQTEDTVPQKTFKMLTDKNSQPIETSVQAPPQRRGRGPAKKAAPAAIPTNLAPAKHELVASVAMTPLAQPTAAVEKVTEPAPAAKAPVAAPVAPKITVSAPVSSPRASAPSEPRLTPSGEVGPAVHALTQALLMRAKEGRLTEAEALRMLVSLATEAA